MKVKMLIHGALGYRTFRRGDIIDIAAEELKALQDHEYTVLEEKKEPKKEDKKEVSTAKNKAVKKSSTK